MDGIVNKKLLNGLLKPIITSTLFFTSSQLQAEEEFQPLDDLYSAARLFVYQQIKVASDEELDISVSNLDSRLRLKKCANPIETFSPPGVNVANSNTIRVVGARCTAPVSWSLYVPVKVAINTRASTKMLPRDQPVAKQDVELVKRDKTNLRQGYMKNSENIISKTLKRPVSTNSLITPELLQASQVIKKGDMVTIIAATAGLTVKTKGQAMQNGEVGETIKVKNEQSKQVIEAIVASAGLVRIPL